jgi:hypothetical protein
VAVWHRRFAEVAAARPCVEEAARHGRHWVAIRSLSTRHCGVRIATCTSAAPTAEAIGELAQSLGSGPFEHIIAFFSLDHEPELLSRGLRAAFPGVPVSGCSTAGEITPEGIADGSIMLIAFPSGPFRVHAALIEKAGHHKGVEHATEIVRNLKARLATDPSRPLRERAFALMLMDGLSNSEEMLVAAVNWAIDDIQLIGGSAGDGLRFDRTALINNDVVTRGGAILIIVETSVPFRVFKTQNFEPTSTKLVVTAADCENRIVHELNAEPAAREYAAAIGLMPDDLGPFSFASYPLVVKVGGDYYCRSIRNMNPDGSLSFFCAIDEGLVFTVARPEDMISSTSRTLEQVAREIGSVDFVLGFDCILRRLDAENRQIRRSLDDLYRRFGVVGFHTYGEQFNAMHLNQTLTGIAFGTAEAAE